MDSQLTSLIAILNNPSYTFLLLVFMAWSLAWKGVALWKSARHHQRNWFILLLILNTLGILEIVYLFYFQRKEQQKTLNDKK